MADIGSFTRTETGFTGRVEALGIDAPLTFVPAKSSDAENAPDYRIHHGAEDGPEIGAGWKRTGEKAGEYVALLIDDPTFPQPRCFGERATRWKASELEAWADTRTGGKRSEPVALTTARAAKRGPKGGRSGGTATPRAQDPLQSCSLKSQEDFVPSATPVEAVAA